MTKKGSIKTFTRREGRMTKRQQQAFQQYWPAYGLSLTNSFYNFNKVFSRKAPTVLEIGFGMGQALLAMARIMRIKFSVIVAYFSIYVWALAVVMGLDRSTLLPSAKKAVNDMGKNSFNC